jgi:hypothetical protein
MDILPVLLWFHPGNVNINYAMAKLNGHVLIAFGGTPSNAIDGISRLIRSLNMVRPLFYDTRVIN